MLQRLEVAAVEARARAADLVAQPLELLVEFERREDLRPEQLGPAAIVRQGHQRVQRVEVALKGTVIGLERPEGQKHTARHAVGRLDPVEDRIVFLRHLLALVDPVLADQAARELDERFLEHALCAVRVDHLLIETDRGEEGINRGPVMALPLGFGFQTLDETVETAAALGEGGSGQEGCQGQGGGDFGKGTHRGSFSRSTARWCRRWALGTR